MLEVEEWWNSRVTWVSSMDTDLVVEEEHGADRRANCEPGAKAFTE